MVSGSLVTLESLVCVVRQSLTEVWGLQLLNWSLFPQIFGENYVEFISRNDVPQQQWP